MKEKYKDDSKMLELVKPEVRVFRPSFVIDIDGSEREMANSTTEEGTLKHKYIEDEFCQLRLKNVLFRQIGPCIRCKTTTLNWEKNIRHPLNEPYRTLQDVRHHDKMGQLFGIYLQPEIIES